jgi:hypothetical protein
MQLTGQTSTQDLSFTPMHGSAMMNGMSWTSGNGSAGASERV